MATGIETKDTIDTLRELGMESAVKKVELSRDLVKKTAVAYEHFDYITPEDVEAFKTHLRAKTEKADKGGYSSTYDTLKFIPLKDYTEVPPKETLEKLKKAMDMKCFDAFEIAKIESVKEVKDPILFGRITDCGDFFFISQWDDDVTIEAIKEAAGKK